MADLTDLNEVELSEVFGGVAADCFDYTIVYGDTLSAIAARFGTTVKILQKLNGILNPDIITAGQHIIIPKSKKLGWI